MSTRFDLRQGLVIVPTRLWGPAGDVVARLALDTGAVRSLVNWEIAVLLGYDPAIVSERLRIVTGSGIEFVPPITVERIEALGETRENFSMLCHTLPPSAAVDGLLGLDFFQGRRLVIDFRAKVVSVE